MNELIMSQIVRGFDFHPSHKSAQIGDTSHMTEYEKRIRLRKSCVEVPSGDFDVVLDFAEEFVQRFYKIRE